MSEALCKSCKNKDYCDTTVRIYGLENMRITECEAYEPKDGDTE